MLNILTSRNAVSMGAIVTIVQWPQRHEKSTYIYFQFITIQVFNFKLIDYDIHMIDDNQGSNLLINIIYQF